MKNENIIEKIIRWTIYFVIFAFLLWPALAIVALVVGIIISILLILAGISLVLLPFAILLRVLKLV